VTKQELAGPRGELIPSIGLMLTGKIFQIITNIDVSVLCSFGFLSVAKYVLKALIVG